MQLFYYLFGGAGLAAGATLMWGYNAITGQWAIDAAVKAERGVQVQLCDKRVADNANTINAHNDAVLDAALDARAALGRTPIDQAELQDLCNGEPECRDAKVRHP